MNNTAERNKVISALEANHIKDAITILKKVALAEGIHEAFDDANRYETVYSGMVQYLGVADPARKDMFAEVKEKLYRCADKIHFGLEKRESSSIYFSTARMWQFFNRNMARMAKELLDATRRLDEEMNEAAKPAIRKSIEEATDEIFNCIWITPHLSSGDAKLLHDILYSDEFSETARLQISTALLLALVAYFDERKFKLLLEGAYSKTSSDKVVARCITGAVITMWLYRKRIAANHKLTNLIKEYCDNHTLRPALLEDVVTNMMQSLDTERINKKMEQEILPEIKNLHSNFMSRFKDEKERRMLLNPEMNPEWEELLNEKGIRDKLMEFTDMQMEGGDMMMIAFSQLKNFNFFRNVSNWFIPFDTNHSGLDAVRETGEKLFTIIEDLPGMICDSDKYSLALSLETMPDAQKNMVIGQLGEQFSTLKEAQEANLAKTLTTSISTEIQMYIRTLYRFDRLYQKGKLLNRIFDTFIDGLSLPVVGRFFKNDARLLQEAEFYLKRNYYSNAVNIYDRLISDDQFRSSEKYGETLQKAGYTHQCLGDSDKALQLYLKAECFAEQNKWLLRKIAELYRTTNNPERAEEYYRRALQYHPDDITLTRSLGNALFDLRRYKEALKCYYKVNYIKGESLRTWRPIAWCEFMEENYPTAGDYYKKILADSSADSQDFMNAGHLALANKNFEEAIRLYKRSLELNKGDLKSFSRAFEADREILLEKGLEDYVLAMLPDKVALG